MSLSNNKQLNLLELPVTNRTEMPYSDRHSIQIGDATETLAAAKIKCWGHSVMASSPGCVYDLLVDFKGTFLRLQVKSKTRVSPQMTFNVRRTSSREGPRHFKYKPDDYDITVLVSLPDQRVLFFPGVHHRLIINREQFLRDGNEYQSWLSAIKAYSTKKEYI